MQCCPLLACSDQQNSVGKEGRLEPHVTSHGLFKRKTSVERRQPGHKFALSWCPALSAKYQIRQSVVEIRVINMVAAFLRETERCSWAYMFVI